MLSPHFVMSYTIRFSCETPVKDMVVTITPPESKTSELLQSPAITALITQITSWLFKKALDGPCEHCDCCSESSSEESEHPVKDEAPIPVPPPTTHVPPTQPVKSEESASDPSPPPPQWIRYFEPGCGTKTILYTPQLKQRESLDAVGAATASTHGWKGSGRGGKALLSELSEVRDASLQRRKPVGASHFEKYLHHFEEGRIPLSIYLQMIQTLGASEILQMLSALEASKAARQKYQLDNMTRPDRVEQLKRNDEALSRLVRLIAELTVSPVETGDIDDDFDDAVAEALRRSAETSE